MASPKSLVESLYEALARDDTSAATILMAEDLEWWFHGPRRCEYMLQILTGEDAGHRNFRFRPRTVSDLGGGWVVAEGWEGKHAYWVHAWDIEDGRIVRFREYFNTSVTVQQLSKDDEVSECADRNSVRVFSGVRRGSVPAAVWESETGAGAGRSLPGLVLAI